MATKTGKKRRRIRIISIDESTLDSGGNPTRKRITEGTRRAAIEYLRGREYFEGNQVIGEATHRITISQDSLTRTITPKWEFQDIETGVRFNVMSCDNLECKRDDVFLVKREY